jgi:hypothetical protein
VTSFLWPTGWVIAKKRKFQKKTKNFEVHTGSAGTKKNPCVSNVALTDFLDFVRRRKNNFTGKNKTKSF